jgi:ribosome-associated protein YbcJ (S4-like RNA binding protein)
MDEDEQVCRDSEKIRRRQMKLEKQSVVASQICN